MTPELKASVVKMSVGHAQFAVGVDRGDDAACNSPVMPSEPAARPVPLPPSVSDFTMRFELGPATVERCDWIDQDVVGCAGHEQAFPVGRGVPCRSFRGPLQSAPQIGQPRLISEDGQPLRRPPSDCRRGEIAQGEV